MNSSTQVINIVDLELDQDNYRFLPTKNQQEAIEMMVSKLGSKITTLAEDIAKHGLNPLVSIGVYPSLKSPGKYIVLEGNRRATCLKLMLNPGILDSSTFKREYAFFSKLHLETQNSPIIEVACQVFPSREIGLRWLNLRHRGAQSGKGQMDWDAKMAERYDEANENIPSLYWQAVRLLKSHSNCPADIDAILDKVSKTNFDRLIENNKVRNLLGITIQERTIFSNRDKDELFGSFLHLMSYLSEINVKDIYTAKIIEEKINDILPKSIRPNASKSEEEHWAFPQYGDSHVEFKPSSKPINPNPSPGPRKNSRKLFTSKSPGSKILINQERIGTIYGELGNLNLDKNVNAAAVLLRVFIELSFDRFIEVFDLLGKNQSATSMSQNLSGKASIVINKMTQLKIVDKGISEGVKIHLNKPKGILSIDEMNGFIHNYRINPPKSDLVDLWNATGDFFDILWKAINKKEEENAQ